MRLRLPQSEEEFRMALRDAAELGAKKALQEVGVVKPYYLLAEAKRIYGRALVEFLLKTGLVRKIKDGNGNCRVRLDRMELETAVKTCNRSEYYNFLEE